MNNQRQLFWQLVGWVAGIAWLGGFMAGTWLDRGSNYLQLFGVAQCTAFAILAAWSYAKQIADRPRETP